MTANVDGAWVGGEGKNLIHLLLIYTHLFMSCVSSGKSPNICELWVFTHKMEWVPPVPSIRNSLCICERAQSDGRHYYRLAVCEVLRPCHV